MMTHEHYRTKEKTLNIMNRLVCYYPERVVDKLWSLNLWDRIMDLFGTAVTEEFKYVAVNLIGNMVLDGETAEKLVEHKIFDKIVSYMMHGNEVVYCLCSISGSKPMGVSTSSVRNCQSKR
jgi:hypothetical protein